MRVLNVNGCVAALGSAALVGLTAGGCSSSTAPAPAGTARSAPTASVGAAAGIGSVPTTGARTAALSAKLIAPADLPAGWGIDATATNPVMQTDCPLLNTIDWNTSLPGHAEVDLNAGMTGPFLVEQIAAGDTAQVLKGWNDLVGGIGKCTTYTHGGAGGSSTFSIVRTSLPAYGDSSYSFTLTIKVNSVIDASGYIVAARNGNSVIVVYLVGLTSLDKTFVESAMSKAVAKART